MQMQISQINRTLANLISIGEVVEVENGKAKIKIDLYDNEDGFTTDFLPFLTNINATYSSFAQARIGALALVLAIDGELSQGVILGFIEKNANKNEFEKDKQKIKFDDGASLIYDAKTQELSVKGIKKISFDVQKIELTGDFSNNGNIKTLGDVKTATVSLNTHTHGSPSGTTTPPTPTPV